MRLKAVQCFGLAVATTLALTLLGCDNQAKEKPGGKSTGEAAKEPGKVRRLVFLTNGDDPFWDTCRAGMDKAAEELKISGAGFQQVMDKGSEFKEDKQIAKLEQYATQSDIAAVAISSVNAKSPGIAQALRTLRDQGVKVICVDADMDHDQYRDTRFGYLGTNNIVAGQELGKAVKGLRPDGGKYATFVGVKTVANAIDRIAGFGQGAGDKFSSADSMADGGDEDRAQENVKSVIDKHPEVDTLVGIWAYNAHAIVRVVELREIRKKTTIAVFDAAQLALADMAAGNVDAMVVQNPYQMGYLSVKLMKALAEKDGPAIKEVFPDYDVKTEKFSKPDGDIFNTELRVVVPEASPLKSDLFRPETKFFHYKDFKKWLDERHLVNS